MAKFARGILEENESPFDAKVLLTQGGISGFFNGKKSSDKYLTNNIRTINVLTINTVRQSCYLYDWPPRAF